MALRLITIALLALGAITAARLTFAELIALGDTPDSLRRAARLAPNAAYIERLGERLGERLADLAPDHVSEAHVRENSASEVRVRNDPEGGARVRDDYENQDRPSQDRASQDLRFALALNPRSSSAWIALGLAAEREGDFAGAARDLEQAARIDRQYLPAWTLANYYFRRGDRTLFWKWAQRAAALAYDDLAPLLTLADRLEPGRGTLHLAPSPKLERAYLDLLIAENRLDDAQVIARMMLERTRTGRGSAEDAPRLRAFTTRLIAAHRGADALEIWSGLSIGGSAGTSTPYRAPSRRADLTRDLIGTTSGLTDSHFGLTDSPLGLVASPSGEGFDWRLPSSAGVSSLWRRSVLDFTLDGRQPDLCPLLERMVPLPADDRGRPCRLRFEYLSGLTGLRWALDYQKNSPPGAEQHPARGASTIPRESPQLEISPVWREWEWSFTPTLRGAPAVSLARLVLIYRRNRGATPAEGRLEIRNLRLAVE